MGIYRKYSLISPDRLCAKITHIDSSINDFASADDFSAPTIDAACKEEELIVIPVIDGRFPHFVITNADTVLAWLADTASVTAVTRRMRFANGLIIL